MKSKKTHFITIIVTAMTMTVYLYSQVNVFSLIFALIALHLCSKLDVHVAWKHIFLSWFYLTIGFVLFYGLFIHQGEGAIFEIPGHIPLLSGTIELSSLVYGLLLGGCITMGLYFFALPAKELQSGTFSLYVPGIWRNITLLLTFLSHFVNFFFSHKSKFDKKIINRNLNISKFQKAKLLLHDASTNGLEHSFTFAEALETRGFSSNHSANQKNTRSLFFLGLGVFVFLIVYRIYHQPWMILLSLFFILMIIKSFVKATRISRISHGYQISLTLTDWVMIIYSLSFSAVCLTINVHNSSVGNNNYFRSYLVFEPRVQLMFFIQVIFLLLILHSNSKRSA